jgi:hypothetical protein
MHPENNNTDFNYARISKLLVAGIFLIQIGLVYIDRMPGLYEEWDGLEYFKIANYFKEGSFKENIGTYYVQRILISLLLWLFSFLTKTDISETNTFIFYTIFNVFCTAISVWCYFKIAGKFHLSKTTKIFGFAGIFYSFFNLKMSSFYPVLLDQAAFTVGFLLLYSLLFQKSILSYAIVFIGSFTFPTVLPFGLLLIAFTENNSNRGLIHFKLNIEEYTRLVYNPFRFTIPLISSFFYLFVIYRLFGSRENSVYKFSSERIISLHEFWPSALLSSILIFIITYQLTSFVMKLKIHYRISIYNIILSLMIFVGVKFIYLTISNQNISQGFIWFPINIIKQSIQFPLAGLASHINYYGPLIILCIIFHKKILEASLQNGIGWFLFFLFNFGLLMLGSESRQFVFFIPFASMMILKLLDHRISEVIQLPLLITHIIICLLFSKFWWIINVAGFAEKASNLHFKPDFDNAIIQRYFIFHGPWMNLPSYLTISSTAAVLFVFYLLIFRTSTKQKNQLNPS